MTTTLRILPALLLAVALLIPTSGMAHSAICSCFDNGDGTVTCEGGFSDGSSASGVRVFVRDMSDETVARGQMNEDSEFTFNKPARAYKVVFDGGPGHQVEIKGQDIVE